MIFKALISHLHCGRRFECELKQQRSEAFKLTKWTKPTFDRRLDGETWKHDSGKIEFFKPSQLSIRRYNKQLLATVKAEGKPRHGIVSQDWALWCLTQIRDHKLIHLMVNGSRFSNGKAINQGNYGPPCIGYSCHPQYSARCIRTYLDNKNNFFFA